MKRFPSYLGPVLILLSVAALIAMVIQQGILSSDEQQVIRDSAEQRSRSDQRYTHCLVARTLAGLGIPPPDAPCVPPTAEQVKAQARASSPVELVAALARCLDPGRSSSERESCVRAAFPTPPTTTTTTQPRGSASRAPPASAMGPPRNLFQPPDPFQPPPTTPPTTPPPLVTLPTIPPVTLPTIPKVPTTVTLPRLP